jgi:osmotically inducible protein OsmC
MKRTANAVWKGTFKEGGGEISTQSGALTDQPYTAGMRFEDESGRSGTNPEELIAAAHSSCFAMQLSAFLANNGTPADELRVTATVEIVPGTGITGSALALEGKVPGIDAAAFQEHAAKAKAGCPVSRALAAVNIELEARLV